jgi:hypothetical protein
MDLAADAFEERTAPGSGRRVVRLTTGDATCYPLYYYVSSLADDRLVYHRAADGEVQLHSLDLTTGEDVRLTDAAATDTHWRPWCTDPGTGVLDHRSALDSTRDRVLYFAGSDGREVRAAALDGSDDEYLFDLPAGRAAIGQNCVTPDGEWFVYIHHDCEGFEELFEDDYARHRSSGTALAAYNLRTGERRTLLRIDSPIHHVLALDDERVVFCHPTAENGMLLTDLEGGWYSHLRTQDGAGGTVCHYLATERGLTYEVLGREPLVGGLYDPETHDRYEFALPERFGYTHTGYDPAGHLFLYETETDAGHELRALVDHDPDGDDEWEALVDGWETCGGGQKAHFHPRMTPDRDWVLFVAGDERTETNHVHLLDVADLDDSGVPDPAAGGRRG